MARTMRSLSFILNLRSKIWQRLRPARVTNRPSQQGYAVKQCPLGTHLEAPSGCLPQDLQANNLSPTGMGKCSLRLHKSTHLERQLISPLFALSLPLCPAIGELEVGMRIQEVTALGRYPMCTSDSMTLLRWADWCTAVLTPCNLDDVTQS